MHWTVCCVARMAGADQVRVCELGRVARVCPEWACMSVRASCPKWPVGRSCVGRYDRVAYARLREATKAAAARTTKPNTAIKLLVSPVLGNTAPVNGMRTAAGATGASVAGVVGTTGSSTTGTDGTDGSSVAGVEGTTGSSTTGTTGTTDSSVTGTEGITGSSVTGTDGTTGLHEPYKELKLLLPRILQSSL